MSKLSTNLKNEITNDEMDLGKSFIKKYCPLLWNNEKERTSIIKVIEKVKGYF